MSPACASERNLFNIGRPPPEIPNVMRWSSSHSRYCALFIRQYLFGGGSNFLLAFAVALVGLAGLLARLVAERRRELAVRAALGASPRRLIAFVMTRGGLVVLAGLVLGVVGALAAGRGMTGLLHGVAPADPATLAGAAGVVALVSIGVCAGPARQAARIDPAQALRGE